MIYTLFIILLMIWIIGIPLFSYYKNKVYSTAQITKEGIIFYKWPLPNYFIPYEKIKQISLSGTLPNYPGSSARIDIQTQEDSELIRIPIRCKAIAKNVLGYFSQGIQIQGLQKEELSALISNIDNKKIDPNLIELVTKGEIELSKISKTIGAYLFKIKI
jgi:hypothetical protein